ncbi:MAG: protein translocase subunit SecD [Gemmatimonadetes bacterium]|nr:protein translocase subunit SecD [Gemmatimonadota bacterium]
MFSTIRSRIIAIAVLAGLCIFSLWPREVTRRARGPDGRMFDTVETRVPLRQGLDLQGGIHLALEIDQSRGVVADPAGALERALTVIRTRIDEFGVAEPLIQKVGTERIIVELPGVRDPARAKDIVQRSAFLEFRITDMQNQFRGVIPQIDAELKRLGIRAAGGAPAAAGAVERLLGGDTTAKGRAAGDTTDANAPGVLSALLFQGSQPGEFLVPEEDYPRVDSVIHLPEVQRLVPRSLELMWGMAPTSQGARSYRAVYAVQSRPIITGEYLTDARAQIDPVYNQAIVTFQLTRAGGRIFGRETGRHVGDNMAIALDGRVQGQPPVIRSQITTRGQIELGNASLQQAQDLALVLRAGALPAPLIIVEERTVGPSLGQDAIEKSIRAGIIGTTLVVLIYAVYYRMAGVLAIAALAYYVLLTLGGLAAFGATLTVPGLAGFILSVGMAIDGNVLIFERIREELALGKSIRVAVDTGFKEAWRAIIDSQLTTLITALFLFQFGTGPVKGFAVTLTLGIIASLITAVFVSRTFFLFWLARRPNMQELSI